MRVSPVPADDHGLHSGTLTRADLADVVHRKLGLSRAESASLVERVLFHMCHDLAEGHNVKISGFGSFILRDKGERSRPQSQDRGRSADRAAPRDDLPRQPDHARPDRALGNRGWRPAKSSRTPSAPSANWPATSASRSTYLRYWETKFPQLKPLQRAGNRRYYRPADVALAKRIHRLLGQEGYTVRGVQKLLAEKARADEAVAAPAPFRRSAAPTPAVQHGGVSVSQLTAASRPPEGRARRLIADPSA